MRLWLVAIFAGLAGWLLARWTAEPAPLAAPSAQGAVEATDTAATDAALQTPPARASLSAIAEVASASSTAALTTVPEVPDANAPRLALDAVAFLRQWPAQLDALAQGAQSGDPKAQIELAEALDYCLAARGAVNRGRNMPSASGDLADTGVMAYFTEVHSACQAWQRRHPWIDQLIRDTQQDMLAFYKAVQEKRVAATDPRPPANAGDALRRRAAEAGESVAEGLTNDDSMRRACGAGPSGQPSGSDYYPYLQCVHAAARERLVAIFARRDPRELEVMPRIVASMGYQLLNGSEFLRMATSNGEDNNVRWILTACEFGLDCGPAGRALRWACINQGACGYRHYRDFAADRLLPPATMRTLGRQVPQLVNLILAGDVDSVLGPPPRMPGAR